MSDSCERIQERLEDSIGRDLGPDAQAGLDLHCAECESCRKYREKLLNDHSRLERLAACYSPSVRRAERRLIEMLPAETPMRAKRPRFRGTFASVPAALRIAVAVAIILAVIMGIDLLRGVRNGSVPAFASVVQKMEKAENLIYRQRDWSLGKWRTEERGENRAGFLRREWADSTRISHSDLGDTVLCLYPTMKSAVLRTTTYVPPPQFRYPRRSSLDKFASLYKQKDFKFVRRERFEGKNAAVYELRIGKRYTWTTWVDADTELPFRVEIVRRDFARSGESYLHGLEVRDFMPPGAPRSAAAGWTDLAPGEPASIYDNFRWNTQLDTSYFSLTPPPGYAVTEIDTVWDWHIMQKQTREEGPYVAREIAKSFSVWVSLSGGVFPEDIHDLVDSQKVKPLLVAKHDKDGKPGDEFRAAIQDAWQLDIGFKYARSYDKTGNFHYLGRGAAFGDSMRVVCWGEETGRELEWYTHPYWIVYADLRCVPSLKPPEIPKK
jgi:hypothetical protein